jgi:NodT family efflux transporter outer membrane factor (OMF) lipoprotein
MILQNILRLKKSFIYILLATIILTSCKVLQPHKLPDLSTNDKLYRELSVSDTSNMANLSWKSLFTDPSLQAYINEAIENNPDMQIAVARMDKAKANLQQSKLAFFPSLTANADGVFQSDVNGDVSKTFKLYGASSWEVDIWGKLRSTKRANMAAFLQSDAYKRAVQTQLVANIAVTYYTLLAYDAQLQITEQTLEKRKANVEAMQLLKDNDVITGADLVLSEANRYAAEVTIPDLKQKIYETENAFCLLLGRNPGAIARGSLNDQNISVDLKYGVPAQLLANRPDVQEAEFQFRYYFQVTNVARTYFYPSLNITASAGITESDLSKLFSATDLLWSVTAGLSQPLFNKGLNKQRLEIARANEQEYWVTYQKTLLQAGTEVVNAMHEYQTATDKITIRSKQVQYLEKSVDFTMELLKYSSSTNYTDVLTAEVNLLSAQLNQVNDKLQQMSAIVTLYQSLGGGCK